MCKVFERACVVFLHYWTTHHMDVHQKMFLTPDRGSNQARISGEQTCMLPYFNIVPYVHPREKTI